MNGRLYDPVLHRFLQPDNYVQDPMNSQNYNRYGYVLNNPLRYTDPTGENFWDWLGNNWKTVVTVVAAVATAVIIVASLGTATPFVAAVWAGAGAGFVGGALGTALNGGNFLESVTAGLFGAGLGAITGGAGAYLSSAIGAVGIIPGALSGSAVSTTLGILGNVMTGRDWDSGIGMAAGFGALGGGLSGLSAARASGAGIWFGTPAARPQVATITQGLTPAGISKTTNEIASDVNLPSPTAPNTPNNVTPFKGYIRKADAGIDGGALANNFSLTRHGELTNGVYTVSKDAMTKHVFDLGQGKSIFYPSVKADEAVLKAAQYADEAGLWIGNKAKVPVLNINIGRLWNGTPTNVINVYRNSNGFIHGSPGTIR